MGVGAACTRDTASTFDGGTADCAGTAASATFGGAADSAAGTADTSEAEGAAASSTLDKQKQQRKKDGVQQLNSLTF